MSILPNHPRISRGKDIMAGKACIAGTRMKVETIIDLLATDSEQLILSKFPFLKADDIKAALAYAKENPLNFRSTL